jgi:hypothetical protein
MSAPKDKNSIEYKEYCEKSRQHAIKQWSDSTQRERASDRMKKRYENPKEREKQSERMKGVLVGEKNPMYGKKGENASMFGKKDEKCPNWKGDEVGYRGIHMWVKKWKGSPHICEDCGKYVENLKAIDWSNNDHLYKRNLDDYVRRCRKCHNDYDILHNFKYKKNENKTT